ncbi:hypothetical protein FH972_011420 [Carpinus fangiana]|uniref:Uncharacterized protein n=1 Tax=Carpinus fangiana TaxID=176857 RepID=A0A660KT50_9ROSI|nr:hypothetical protein FH972_011420 [Carpinus fangiana]
MVLEGVQRERRRSHRIDVAVIQPLIFDVAELIEVYWLDVRGKFEITKPSPDINTYEVAFVLKLEEQASGWEVPLNLTLILPDGNKQKRRENLAGKPRGKWIEIQVGKFVASPERSREIEFAIYELNMLEEQASQWEVPVNVTLILPDGNKQGRKEYLEGKPKGEWIEIPVSDEKNTLVKD